MNTIQSGKQIQTSGYAFVNGIDMYYEIHSQGEPLVLIHGGGSTIQTTFGYLLPILSGILKLWPLNCRHMDIQATGTSHHLLS
ncbi:MAG TPA: hypothetical protein VNS32_13870, partial [Flavisolibacter sp.]|nr:hypothetical protein [Flavisolibacter sp.]